MGSPGERGSLRERVRDSTGQSGSRRGRKKTRGRGQQGAGGVEQREQRENPLPIQPDRENVAHDPPVCQNQTYLAHEALRQAHLPMREGGFRLTSSNSIKGAVYIGYPDMVLGLSLPLPGGTFHLISNGCLADPWRQCYLKSQKSWPPTSRKAK